MPDVTWQLVLVGLLVVFFVFGGVVNLYGPEAVTKDFARWGYPPYFHLVTGALELLAAVLLVFPATRLIGVALGGSVMLAAAATLLFQREFTHMIPALVVVGLLVLVARAA